MCETSLLLRCFKLDSKTWILKCFFKISRSGDPFWFYKNLLKVACWKQQKGRHRDSNSELFCVVKGVVQSSNSIPIWNETALTNQIWRQVLMPFLHAQIVTRNTVFMSFRSISSYVRWIFLFFKFKRVLIISTLWERLVNCLGQPFL